MGVKMNLRIIAKNLAADPEIGFLTKSILKPFGRATALPTAWKLKMLILNFLRVGREKSGSFVLRGCGGFGNRMGRSK